MLIIGTVSSLLLAVLFFKIVNADPSANIPQLEIVTDASAFDLATHIPNGAGYDVYKQFPYTAYLDSANIRNIRAIKRDLSILDTLTHDPGSNRRTLSHALTEIRGGRLEYKFSEYQPDSLLVLIQWAEQFQYYAQFDQDNDIFYQSIYTYWLGFATNKLAVFSRQDPSLRHDFKFKYLVARCNEKKFSTPVKVSSFEKVLDNILYSNWGHLIHASWNQSSWLLKTGMLLFFLVTAYGFFSLVKRIIRLKK
jgi:hypothetical protein